jgi:hypothetical protein
MNVSNLAIELWDVLRDHIPGKKTEAARAFLQVFAENGADREDMLDVREEDSDLDAVFDDVFEEEETDWGDDE